MKKVLNILLCSVLALALTACGEKKESSKKYYCEEGTLNGENCETIETEEVKQSCEDGYTLEDGKCTKTTTTNAKGTQSCSDGYTLSGNTCLSKETYDKVTTQECRLPAKFDIGEYTDSEGNKMHNSAYVQNGECWYIACTDWDNGVCYGGESDKTEFTTISTCPSGTKEVSGKCYKTSQAKTTYTCESGTLDGSKCSTTETKEPLNNCDTDGFTYNSETKTCEKITTTKALEKEN